MISRMDIKSEDVIIDEIDFTTMPGTNTAVLGSKFVKVPLRNAYQAEGPWEFSLTNHSRNYLDLKRTYLVFTFDITDTAGNFVQMDSKLLETSMSYAPINNIAGSIIKTVTLHINSQLVYGNSTNHAYKSYFENLLNYSQDIKDSTLSAAGFYHDTAVEEFTSLGYQKRCLMVFNPKPVQVATNISIDLMNQSRLLLNSCKATLTVYPNTSDFLIEGHNLGTKKLKLNIRDVYALVHEYELTDGLSNELEAALIEHKLIQYPMISTQVRSFYIGPSRLDAPANTLFTSKMPRRIFLGLVSAEAYNGSQKTSPFNFKPYGLKNVHIDYCGKTVPGRPLELDFENNKFIEAFIQMQEAIGHSRNNSTCNSINTQMFKEKGFTIYGFELSPVALDNSLFEMVVQTNVSIRLDFKEKTPENGLYCVVVAEFDALMGLDTLRNPILDATAH
ncbi:hypothetical protein CRE_19789 [Caenorhabditis remanei]|uniref:Uncharacterized protein n=1 Tax=Caenorhabditis remanei TaxID=31234 RepID=E3MTB5_CAERE|nr:hypothetical protein CRE_19789 [Caenorhabditis remanei]